MDLVSETSSKAMFAELCQVTSIGFMYFTLLQIKRVFVKLLHVNSATPKFCCLYNGKHVGSYMDSVVYIGDDHGHVPSMDDRISH